MKAYEVVMKVEHHSFLASALDEVSDQLHVQATLPPRNSWNKRLDVMEHISIYQYMCFRSTDAGVF
jgi:hypothetical protein